MTLQEKIEKQKELLDAIPAQESRDILVCEDCGKFVYLQPVTEEGVCQECGSTYVTETRVKHYG